MKVICTLPNASAEINGVKFVSHKLGMISEDMEDAKAKDFASIPGYFLQDANTGDIVLPDGGTAPTPPASPVATGSGTLTVMWTPDSIAALAKDLNPSDRQQLIKILLAQQSQRLSHPQTPASGAGASSANSAPAGSPSSSASAAQAGAPSSSTSPPSKPPAENPSF